MDAVTTPCALYKEISHRLSDASYLGLVLARESVQQVLKAGLAPGIEMCWCYVHLGIVRKARMATYKLELERSCIPEVKHVRIGIMVNFVGSEERVDLGIEYRILRKRVFYMAHFLVDCIPTAIRSVSSRVGHRNKIVIWIRD